MYLYRAEDPSTGRVEFEYDHVLRGDYAPNGSLRPDPDEVAELRWAHPDELRVELAADPESYAPWLGGVLSQLTGPGAAPAEVGGADRSGGR